MGGCGGGSAFEDGGEHMYKCKMGHNGMMGEGGWSRKQVLVSVTGGGGRAAEEQRRGVGLSWSRLHVHGMLIASASTPEVGHAANHHGARAPSNQ